MNYINTKTVLIAFACISLLCCKDQSQKTPPGFLEKKQENYISDKLVQDPENDGAQMLLGKVNYVDFKNDSLFPWMSENFKAYKPDSITLIGLKKELKGVYIKAFMGTWCEDSQREVPSFYKILKSIGINEERIDMIAVSHDKDTPQGYEKELNIAYVPTFIFYKQEQELGRFVEYAQGATLEEDILTIVTNQPYIPAYQ
ncbi:thioredoxin family protein [Flavobacteriaceae bacterium]|nr:thioredoxin family protein [Flavobacteriaceae bacterium]